MPSTDRYFSLLKIERNRRNTFRMSTKIEAASSGAARISAVAAEPLEIEGRQPGEDHEAGDCVDDRATRNLYEQEHDPEHDQRDQRPEKGTRKRREVPPGRISDSTEAGDEQCRRRARLPDRLRIGADIESEGGRDRGAE
jgi:hypothetical protein